MGAVFPRLNIEPQQPRDGQNSQESARGGLSSCGPAAACLRGLSKAGVGVARGLAWPWVQQGWGGLAAGAGEGCLL